MAKSKPKSSGTGVSAAEIQRRIERLDREIVQLANERARLAIQTAQSLKDRSLPLFDSVREQELLAAAVQTGKGPLPPETVRAVIRELIGGCRSLVKPTRVAYLGPPYSYSHQAAIEFFGTSVEFAPVGTIAAVFAELNRAHADYGLVPLENSTDGRVADTLETFARLPVRICGEVPLRIHHNLLAKCPRHEIGEVFSKPQALSQCRDWLAKQLPGVRLVEITSTAAAAQVAADKPGAAAVASMQAAMHYGLNVVAANIEDKGNNVTRFAVIGGESRRAAPAATRLLSCSNCRISPGALADAMLVFKRKKGGSI